MLILLIVGLWDYRAVGQSWGQADRAITGASPMHGAFLL